MKRIKKFLQEHKIKFTTPDDKFRGEMKKIGSTDV